MGSHLNIQHSPAFRNCSGRRAMLDHLGGDPAQGGLPRRGYRTQPRGSTLGTDPPRLARSERAPDRIYSPRGNKVQLRGPRNCAPSFRATMDAQIHLVFCRPSATIHFGRSQGSNPRLSPLAPPDQMIAILRLLPLFILARPQVYSVPRVKTSG